MGKKPEILADRAVCDFLQRLADEELLARSDRAAKKARFKLTDTEEIIRAYRQRKRRECLTD